jgi:hypothetical protein
VTIEQRIAQQLADSLTDAEFDTLSAEADADAKLCRCGAPLAEHRYGPCRPDHDEVPFRDGGDVPAAQPAIPLDHDGRGPRVDTRRDDKALLMDVFARSVQTPYDCHKLLIAVWERLQELDAEWPVIVRATNCELFSIDEILPAGWVQR